MISLVTNKPLPDQPKPLHILLHKVELTRVHVAHEKQCSISFIISCPQTKLEGGLQRLHSADNVAVQWLMTYRS